MPKSVPRPGHIFPLNILQSGSIIRLANLTGQPKILSWVDFDTPSGVWEEVMTETQKGTI